MLPLIRHVLFFFLSFVLLPLSIRGGDIVFSPDRSIIVQCNLKILPNSSSNDIRFAYDISYKGIRCIENAPLGIDLLHAPSIDKDFRVYKIQRISVNDTINQIIGPCRSVHNNYNQLTVGLQERQPPFRIIEIIFRVSNDGVAFRYVLPTQKNLNELSITNENSRFCFPSDYTAYVLMLESFSTHYENNYRIMPIGNIHYDAIIGLPLLINTHRGLWMAISEANLTDYSGMYLTRCNESRYGLKSILSPRHDSPAIKVRSTPPLQTPWRVILIGEEPGDLIESNFIFTLNDSCAIEDPSWIKPGKCVWPWWSGRHVEDRRITGGMDTETLLHYLDFASEQGFEYLLIDAGWYGTHNRRHEDITVPVPGVDLERIIAEGKRKHVKILLWLFWECVEDQIDRAFPLYQQWGIAGVKIDYMNRDDQKMVQFYRRVVTKAAEHQLLVNFHGAYKPTGIRKMYPNLITRESVLGLEWSKWSHRCDPEHELLIPFTRMLAGPMDFTPGCFRTALKETFNPEDKPPKAMGTRCHQLAMYVVYQSPLQMCVDYPASYRNQPGITFLKSVPATWDETRVLNGEVGDYITVARRHGDTWYIGAMTDWTPRELFIPLDFLDEGTFIAEIYSDKADVIINPAGVLIRNARVTSSDRLVVPLGPGGGYAAKLSPAGRPIAEKQPPSIQSTSQKFNLNYH